MKHDILEVMQQSDGGFYLTVNEQPIKAKLDLLASIINKAIEREKAHASLKIESVYSKFWNDYINEALQVRDNGPETAVNTVPGSRAIVDEDGTISYVNRT